MLWYSGAIVLGLGSAAGGLYGMLSSTEPAEPGETESVRSGGTQSGETHRGKTTESTFSPESAVESLLTKLKTLVPVAARDTADRIGELYLKVVASLELVSSEEGNRYTLPQRMKILHQASSFMNLLRMHFDKLHQGARLTVQRQNTEEEYQTYQVALRAEFDVIAEIVEDLQGRCLNLMS